MTRRVCLGLVAVLGVATGPADLRAQATTVILVRHAETAAPSADPDLSPAGQARAAALAVALERFPLGGVLVSEYRRTRQTAESTAVAHGLVPLVVPVGDGPTSHAGQVAARIQRLPMGSAALVVGHSNTLALIIAALGGPRIPDLCDGEYATLYLLELPGEGKVPRLLRASYGVPDPPGAGDCAHQMRLQ
jgi:broad specificity phosphatase PhoE